MDDYTVKLYMGFPETSGDSLDEMVEKGHLVPIPEAGDNVYDLLPGIYSCHITGERIYPTLKIFSLKEAVQRVDLKAMMAPVIVPLVMADDKVEGYQPTVVVPDAPEFFMRTQKDELLCIWPEEILEIYSDKTVPTHHQWMKQEEMEAALETMQQRCEMIRCYTMGTSCHYGFSIPMVILSKDAPKTDSWEEALRTLSGDKKVNIFYQAQVHGNEPAACEGALAVLERFCDDPSMQELLETVNLVIIPRANPEAAYLYRRMAYDNIDLNRDHMACGAYETRLLHKAFQLLEPEVVLDGHEFTFFVTDRDEEGGFVKMGCQIMSSPATSLNIQEPVRAASYEICEKVFAWMQAQDYKIYHFGTAEKASLGRGFYGLHQCLSFLIETRGIGGGRYGCHKRVLAQRDIMTAYIKTVAAAHKEIKETVKAARLSCGNLAEIVLEHDSSETVYTPYEGINEQYYLDGSLRGKTSEGLLLKDLPARARAVAKAYVLPAEMEHMDEILEKVACLGCDAELLQPGTSFHGLQYCSDGPRQEDGHEKDIVAGLTEEKTVVLEKGGWKISAKDYKQIPLAMLMEPDVTDMVGTKGTLFQQGLLDFDPTTGLFPLYRVR